MSEWIELPWLSLAESRFERIIGPFRLRVELLSVWCVEWLTDGGDRAGGIESGIAVEGDVDSAKAEAEDCLRQRLTEWLCDIGPERRVCDCDRRPDHAPGGKPGIDPATGARWAFGALPTCYCPMVDEAMA